MSPALNGCSAVWCFEWGDAIKISDGIIFDFYAGLYSNLYSQVNCENLITQMCFITSNLLIYIIIKWGSYMYFFRLSSGVSNGYSSGAHGMTASMRSSSAPAFDKQGHTVSLMLWSEPVAHHTLPWGTCYSMFGVVFSFSMEIGQAKWQWHSYGVKPECYICLCFPF